MGHHITVYVNRLEAISSERIGETRFQHLLEWLNHLFNNERFYFKGRYPFKELIDDYQHALDEFDFITGCCPYISNEKFSLLIFNDFKEYKNFFENSLYDYQGDRYLVSDMYGYAKKMFSLAYHNNGYVHVS